MTCGKAPTKPTRTPVAWHEPAQSGEVDTADAARHVKVLADDDACPVIVYTDDASSVLMAVYHNNRWVEETC